MKQIVFDESGNTGANLSDGGQPVCVVGSSSLDVELADELLAKLRHNAKIPKDQEIKFSRMRSLRSKEEVLNVLRDERLTHKLVKLAFANKRHVLAFKVVDLLVEPQMYGLGYNMYKDGSAKGLANLLALTAPVLGDPLAWDAVLDLLVDACVSEGYDRIYALNRAIRQWAVTAPDLAREAELLRYGVPEIIKARQRGKPLTRHDFDPAIPLFVDVTRAWSDQEADDFLVLHDESKVIAEMSETLSTFDRLPDPVNDGVSLQRLRIAPGSLRADGKSTVDPRLQVVDLVAGAARAFSTPMAVGARLDEIQLEFRDLTLAWTVNAVWVDPGLFDATDSA